MAEINYGDAEVIALPCPFCGSEDLGFHADGGDPTPGMVECNKCDSTGPWVEGKESYQRAHQAWNIRGDWALYLSWSKRGLLERELDREKSAQASPCPFCGSKDIRMGDKVDWDQFFFACCNCDACGPWTETMEEALEGWNRRFKPLFGPEKKGIKIAQIVAADNVKVHYASAHLSDRYETLSVPIWALMSDGKVIGLEIHEGRLVPVNEKSLFFIGYSEGQMASPVLKNKAEKLLKSHDCAGHS